MALIKEGVEGLNEDAIETPVPNAAWHIDGYNKLAPCVFHVSGCIDGYSRRIMFLQVAAPSHDPSVIAHYYLGCIEQVQGYLSAIDGGHFPHKLHKNTGLY